MCLLVEVKMRAFSIFLSFVVISASASQNINDINILDIPEEIIEDLLQIIFNGTVAVLTSNCKYPTNSVSKTEYWVYTNENPLHPSIFTNANLSITQLGPKVILIAHGWVSSANTSYIAAIKDQYLRRYNATVISVNWFFYSFQSYFCAYTAVPDVASNVADLLCELSQRFGISLDAIHVVGHSLGAHLFGFAGRLVRERCSQKIGRITGLDPAGPLYDGINITDRLDPKDAIFVDVLHSNVGQAGYLGSLGHLDSYANCGYYQPGCATLVIQRDVLQNITAILDLPIDFFTCSHLRSCEYFAESITSDGFVAQQCIGCGLPTCFPNTFASERIIIGEDCTKPGEVRNYVFDTNLSPPYAQG